MPKFIIERELPGTLSEEELAQAGKTSCDVLKKMGGSVQWVQSYVTEGKLYCVYIAPSEEDIRKHAEEAKVPVTKIQKVNKIIDPSMFE